MLFSRAGRDDADNFFAIVFLPINVNHQQHGSSSEFIPNRADCVPALLSGYSIDTIWSDQASLVLEHESGQLEGDSAVSPLISEVLDLVPFVTHIVYTDCITNSKVAGRRQAAAFTTPQAKSAS
jgi:hypothetical protein